MLFSGVKKHWYAVAITMVCVLMSALFITNIFKHNAEIKRVIAQQEQNTKAFTEEVNEVKAKNGDLISQKAAFMVERKQLKETNKELHTELRTLEKSLKDKKVNEIVKTQFIVEHDTIFIEKFEEKVLDDSIFSYIWTHKDKWSYIKGKSYLLIDSLSNIRPIKTTITDNEIYFSIVTGTYRDKDGFERIYVKTDNPNLILRDLKGAILTERRRRKGPKLSIHGGFGVVYDMQSDNFGYGPYVGAGLSFDIFSK